MQESFSLSDWQPRLKQWVKQARLQGLPCHVVLAGSEYSLLQVEKPKVPEAEVVQALQWAVKDLLADDKEQVLDYFDLPSQTTGANKVNVVAAPRDLIESICTGLFEADVELKSIGIEELATCDLMPQSDEGIITLIQQPGQEIHLNVVKNRNLYFSRRLKGYENLGSFSEQELQMGIVDSLSVQIQRSMDYFESQLRQAPVKRILLSVDSPVSDALAQQISNVTLLPVDPYQPQVSHSDNLRFTSACFNSLSAALVEAQQSLANTEEDAA